VTEHRNVELAEELSLRKGRWTGGWEDLAEVVEAIALGLVAVATAWSGYQATQWHGLQAFLYGRSAAIEIVADERLTLGGQQRLQDVSTFNTWIQARSAGDSEVADLYVERFSPEFRVAFDAWLATDPFENPDALPGPSFMPEYENLLLEEGAALNDRARTVFHEGTEARETAEQYVRLTVILATVLFLIALSQRFKVRNVRIGVLVVAGALLVYDIVSIAGLPRL
jgi:hypothetical protein